MNNTARVIVLPVQSRNPPPARPDPMAEMFKGADPFIRPRGALLVLGCSKSTLYKLIVEDPAFPKVHHITPRVTGWPMSELVAYRASKRAPIQLPPLS